MEVTIDRAGRVVVPKPQRDALGLTPDVPLDIELVGDHLELRPRHPTPEIVEGPNGPVIARTGTPLSDAEVRGVLESVRDKR
jgi:AbrB family looped-hinge helix DNA binding protein